MRDTLRKAAVETGISNAVFNGLLTWFSLGAVDGVPISLDSIRTGSGSVLGRVVGSSFVLAFLLTLLTFYTTRKKAASPGSPLAPLATSASIATFARTALRHAIFAFGALTLLGVLWQRSVGTVVVSRLGASLLTAVLAGATAATASYLTLVEMLRRAQLDEARTDTGTVSTRSRPSFG